MPSRPGFDKMQYRLALVFLLLALCIITAGYLYYMSQKKHIKKNIEEELSAIADLKVSQIAAWRKERIGNATVISKNTFLASAVRQFLENPDAPGLKQDILDWMKSRGETYGFTSILLVDTKGNVRLSTVTGKYPYDPQEKKTVQAAMNTKQALLSDIHSGPVTTSIHLTLIAPFILHKNQSEVPVGALLINIDPRLFLYPLIQSWPGPSNTAETLLFRREGDEIVYLNELRHRKNTALAFRLLLDKKKMPAIWMALSGGKDVIEELDYRKVPVLVAARAVPQTTWFLIAKMDVAEMYAPIRTQAWQVTIMIALLIGVAGLSIIFWWRRKSAEYARKQYESELERKTLSDRYHYLSKYANDIILLVDPGGSIVEANDRAVASYGYDREELLRLNVRDIRFFETWDQVRAQMKQVREHNGFIFETIHRRKNGTTFPVEVSSRVMDGGGKSCFQNIIRDITERKRAESSLRERNAFIEKIINNLPIGLAVNTIEDGKALFVNPAFEEIYGWPKNILVNVEEFFNHVYPDPVYRRKIQERILSDIASRDPLRMRWENVQITTMAGKKKLVTALNIPFFEQNMMISTVQDITAYKKADDRLTTLNECFLSFGPDPNQNINRLVALCGEHFDAACALYNRLEDGILHALGQWNAPPDFNPKDKADGHICYDVITKGGSEARVIRDLSATPYAQTDPNVLRYGLKTYIGTAVVFGGSSGGSLCIVYTHDYNPSKDELKFLGVIASAIGVEENRKKTISALLESENRYKHLVESITDYIYTVEVENGRPVTTVHGPGCVTVTGYTSEEYRADPGLWFRMIVDEDRNTVIALSKKILTGAPVPFFEHRIIHKDGSIRWVRNTPVQRYDNEGRLIAYDGLITDITQLKLLENQLRQAQKMEAVGQLAGGVAHDFNNILTAIIGYSHLLLMKVETNNPIRTYVEQIIASSERAAHLTNSLLAFSRKQLIALRSVNLNDIIKRVEKLLGRVIGEDIEVKTRLAETDLSILADSIQIEQVLMNLAANARDAMPDGGVLLIETEVMELGEEFVRTHSYGKPGPYACLSVTDTGIGMDEKTRQRIFEPFFTTKEVGKGTGLGLSMVYGIIKQHSGYINVISEAGKGAAFKAYLPLIRSGTEGLQSEASVAVPHRGTETVLLAEDDDTVRNLTRNILEGYGYQVIEAVDGEDAIRIFIANKDRIDLLLFDVIMPKKNGNDAYLEIKKMRADIKALFTSGYTADIIYKKGILESGLDFVLKPVTPANLLNKMREVLDRK